MMPRHRLPFCAPLLAAVIGLNGCNPKSVTSERGSTLAGAGAPCGSGGNALVQATDGGGTISFRLSGDADPCSVEGYVVGSNTSTLERQSDNSFVMSGVDEDSQDIILTGRSAGSTGGAVNPTDIGGSNLQSATVDRGVRLNGLVAGGNMLTVKLGKLGTIAGRVKLSGQSDHTGIDVYVPGTSYAAKTDASGRYRMDAVPPGIHDLRFEFPGYGTAAAFGIDVASGANVNAPDMTLFTGTGASRLLVLNDDGNVVASALPEIASRVVRFAIQTTGTPRLMKISEDGNFANVEWQPYRSTSTYVFKNDGSLSGGRAAKRLSVRTFDGTTEAELETSVIVELFAEARGAEVLTLDNLDAAGETALLVRIRATLPKNAVQMRASLRSDFVGASWKAAAATSYLNVDAEGAVPVFLQFRDQDLIVSDTYSGIADVRIFPADSITYSVADPSRTIGDDTTFVVEELQSPRRSGNVSILVGGSDSLADAASYPFEASLNHDFGSIRDACGLEHLYLWLRYEASVPGGTVTITSAPIKRAARYACAQPVVGFPGQPVRWPQVGLSGQKLFVWGGAIPRSSLLEVIDTGYLFDTATKAFTSISSLNNPGHRSGAATFDYNSKFVVFGGETDTKALFDGGIYDPDTDTWTYIPPPAPEDHGPNCDMLDDQFGVSNDIASTNVFLVGNRLVVWGNRLDGEYYCPAGVGFIFNLETFLWTTMNRTNAPNFPCNSDRDRNMSAVVAGDKIVAWSGLDCHDDDNVHSGGAIFDPVANAWTTINPAGAPSDRFDYVTAWTGQKLMVFGGAQGTPDEPEYDATQNGAILNVTSAAWEPLTPPPLNINLFSAGIYTGFAGNKVAIFGGFRRQGRSWGGLVYDVAGGTWSAMSTTDAPTFVGKVLRRVDEAFGALDFVEGGAAVDGRLVIWTRAAVAADLDRPDVRIASYDIATNTWTPLATRDRSLAELRQPLFFRNEPVAIAGAGKLLIFGGDVPLDDIEPDARPVLDGAILSLP